MALYRHPHEDTDLPDTFPWAHTPQEVLAILKSGTQGLSEADALSRLSRYGQNEFRRRKKTSALSILLRQFGSPLIFILIAAAVITLLLREWIETFVVLLAVVVNAALGFFQEYRAENTLERLEMYMKDRARVLRGGAEHEIESSFLVPGDIVRLSLGMRVPADVRLLTVNGFSVEESFLTGESLPVQKSTAVVSEAAPVTERVDMAFAGSLVVEGTATAVVVGTGERTEIGRIAELVSASGTHQTPLQRSLSRLAWLIFAGVSVIVAGLFALGVSRGEPILEMLLLSAATAIGAVPEALPIALTVILAVGVERIAKKRGIMRSLSAAETLGSTTIVLTDKTGTLTKAQMKVTSVLTTQALLRAGAGPGSQRDASILSDALLSTEAVVENPQDETAAWRYIGRPIEVHIARAALESGVDILAIEKKRNVLLPFNSTNKFAVGSDGGARCVALGAPEILLARSDLSKDDYLALEEKILAISGEGKRLLGIAHLPEGSTGEDYANIRHLRFAGVIVLYDPIRPEAKRAVSRIERHGARVVMVTGDLKGTAAAIARELGWDVTDANIMTGEQIRALRDDELAARLPLCRIFARVTPEDKLRIALLFQKQGEVVAMTGDGVNDAPSLKAVNIGIALGSGTDVAKSAADLVLLDDNFETIVLAIEEGRRILSNIRKTFVYLMSTCLDGVFLIGGSILFGLPLPLTAIQIIWVNFFTGSFPALAFAFEKNNDTQRRANTGIFSAHVQVLTVGVGVLSSYLLFAVYAFMLKQGVDLATARTVLFMCFSSYILVAAFSFKSLQKSIFTYPLFDNRVLNYGICISAALLALSILVPALRDVLHISPIGPAWIFAVVAWLAFNVAIVEVAKWICRTLKL